MMGFLNHRSGKEGYVTPEYRVLDGLRQYLQVHDHGNSSRKPLEEMRSSMHGKNAPMMSAFVRLDPKSLVFDIKPINEWLLMVYINLHRGNVCAAKPKYMHFYQRKNTAKYNVFHIR
jgi:hypothetical protein